MEWGRFDNGATVSQRGSENGVIVRDEEHELGARITLEHGCDHAPFAITCGIYGWMFHTRYLGSEEMASVDFERMKVALAAILAIIPLVNDPQADAKIPPVCDEIRAFVERFP